jgi:hypothetical protein
MELKKFETLQETTQMFLHIYSVSTPKVLGWNPKTELFLTDLK